jgi:iron(III) transport system ATP-binding protein
LRAEMRVELRALQHRLGVTSLYVTHDQEEALAISDRVIVMNVGGIEQLCTPEDIYNRPKTRFVADFVGSANLIVGRVGAGASGPGPVDFDAVGGVKLQAWASHAPRGGENHVAVRTAYIDMAPGSTNGNANGSAPGNANGGANYAPGTIRQRLFHGDFIQYIVDWPCGALTVRRPPTEMFDEGAAVTLFFAPEHCILLEA